MLHRFYTALFGEYFESMIIKTAINKGEVFLLH